MLAATPVVVRADEAVASVAAMVPSIWVSLPGLSTFVSSLALLGMVVVVEATVLALAFRQSWRVALGLSSLANLVTTVLGLMLVATKGIGLIIFFVTFACAYVALAAVFKWRVWLRVLFLVLFPIITFLTVFIDQPTVPRMIVQFYATMLYSFLMTLFFEASIFAWKAGSRQAWRWSLAANGTSYLLLFVFLMVSGFRSGSLIALEGPRYELARLSYSTMDRREVIRRYEEFYLWERSARRSPSTDDFEWPIPELRVVKNWAKAGHKPEAKDLYSVIVAYRPRHIAGHDAKTYDYFWAEAEGALK